MSITLEKAIDVFKQEVGHDGTRSELVDAVAEGIEFVLLNGGGELLREWEIIVRDGRFTFPRDLETPIKYKFSRFPSTGFGTFVSPFFSYSSNALQIPDDYLPWQPHIEKKINRVFTQYDPPSCGVRLVFTTKDNKDIGKKVIVNGSYKGKEIVGIHNGVKTSGEVLTVYSEQCEKKYSSFVFDRITGVVRDETCSWTMLSGLDCRDSKTFYFLSHYHPNDITPSYRQGEVVSPQQSGHEFSIKIIGKVNPSIRYTQDEEILPITSLQILKLLAKRLKSEDAGDLEKVAVMEQRIKNVIRKHLNYQQPPARGFGFGLAGSAASSGNV